MVAIIFGIQGVGKSSIVNGALANVSKEEDFRLLQWGKRTFEITMQKNIIRTGDYKTQANYQLKSEDTDRGVAIVITEQGENVIYAKDEACVQNARDEMRNLDVKTQKMIQDEVANSYIQEISANPNLHYLIETHAALKTQQGYLPGLTPEFMQKVKPDVYVIIEASAEQILARRMSDKNRKREHDKTLKDVQINLDTTRFYTSNFAVSTHSPMCIVENKDNGQDEAIEELTRILKTF